MTPTMEKSQPLPLKKILANRWFPIVLLVIPLLIAQGVTPAYSSYTPGENLLDTPNPSLTATATATRTMAPTATLTTTPTPATPEIRIKVSGELVNLRTGPGTNFSIVHKLNFYEHLVLLGRLNDDSWLYVRTFDGWEGWIKTTLVNLTGVDVNDQPIATPAPPPEALITVSNGPVNLRTGPGMHYAKVLRLVYGDQLVLLGRVKDNSWVYVEAADGQEGWIQTMYVNLGRVNLGYDYFPVETPPPTETSTPVVLQDVDGHWIDIDLSEQTLRAYDGTTLMNTFLVSTGLYQYPTEVGQYHIFSMRRFADMHGSDYFLPDVPYTMYYSGDFAIHGTYWHHNFGTPMSHGCVNMDTRDAEWLFNFSAVGTLVNIHR